MKPDRTHLTQRLDKLKAEGYTADLLYAEDRLIDLKTKKSYTSEDVKEFEEHRFEGMTNPSDQSILFAVTLSDGVRGSLSAVYGPQADASLFDFFKRAE